MRNELLKWWIIGSDIYMISSDEGTLLDLCHSFTHLKISGKSPSLFLNQHLQFDLREKFYPINSIASSTIIM